MALVCKPNIPTERLPLVGEVSANFADRGCRMISTANSRLSRPESLLFLPSTSSVVLTMLCLSKCSTLHNAFCFLITNVLACRSPPQIGGDDVVSSFENTDMNPLQSGEMNKDFTKDPDYSPPSVNRNRGLLHSFR
jgi:hypothetical protein